MLAVSGGLLAVAAVAYGDEVVATVFPSTEEAVGSDGASDDDGQPNSPTTAPRDCSPQPPSSVDPIAAAEPRDILLELSRRLHPCAERVVVAGVDPAARWSAANVAIDSNDVFLLVDDTADSAVVDELTRLEPEEVILLGVQPETAATLAGEWELSEQPVDPTAQPPSRPTTPAATGSALWVLDGGEPDLAGLLTPAAARTQAEILELAPPPATGTSTSADRLDPASHAADRLRTAGTVQLIGSFSDTDAWRLSTIASGVELPGGGLAILPEPPSPPRRYIAFYGAPGTSLLGVLGEQDPAATLGRMQPLLAEYQGDDGAVVIPTFELIATVAAYEAGDDGDYSNETSVGALRPYVDYAAANGVYVLLDLQPGRTDFLTQAKRYEELLREPHVGLALDPEWRLEPDQVHLRQLGSVDAAEVNEVSAWLAELVRQQALPQKMLLIHQFQQSMVTNREAIEERPELSIVIQMDGQGPLGTKYGTLAALIRGGEDGPWRWGWKNFYDEDTPMATPAQTLAVDPRPVYVSYQ